MLFESTIYFLECQDSSGQTFVKIGKANDPWDRITNVVCGLPHKVSRVRYVDVPGYLAIRIERHLHLRLAKWKSRGEWFCFPHDDPDATAAYEIMPLSIIGEWFNGAAFRTIDWAAYEKMKAAKSARYLEAKKAKRLLKKGRRKSAA